MNPFHMHNAFQASAPHLSIATVSDVLCQAGVTCVTSLVLYLLFAEGFCLNPHRVQAPGSSLTMALAVSGL